LAYSGNARQQSCSTSRPVSTWMGDRSRVLSWYITSHLGKLSLLPSADDTRVPVKGQCHCGKLTVGLASP